MQNRFRSIKATVFYSFLPVSCICPPHPNLAGCVQNFEIMKCNCNDPERLHTLRHVCRTFGMFPASGFLMISFFSVFNQTRLHFSSSSLSLQSLQISPLTSSMWCMDYTAPVMPLLSDQYGLCLTQPQFASHRCSGTVQSVNHKKGPLWCKAAWRHFNLKPFKSWCVFLIQRLMSSSTLAMQR